MLFLASKRTKMRMAAGLPRPSNWIKGRDKERREKTGREEWKEERNVGTQQLLHVLLAVC